ncbi:hypothetical protein BV25DRAFT_1994845 [Artomyces pyxidatus]|uniref:Uncharacterized protein n=2 Tax=Artomyces pyxidatus TaxID=48021 RepID=A0ACB8SM50_9AGAM|nr:hypothetical protein BV25DRAFT_1996360 [Artomyces pyxidatus]KAI0057538.1 hypothetical protein BV25DRAFT_1994845 [Artomyces pyxidatus]
MAEPLFPFPCSRSHALLVLQIIENVNHGFVSFKEGFTSPANSSSLVSTDYQARSPRSNFIPSFARFRRHTTMSSVSIDFSMTLNTSSAASLAQSTIPPTGAVFDDLLSSVIQLERYMDALNPEDNKHLTDLILSAEKRREESPRKAGLEDYMAIRGYDQITTYSASVDVHDVPPEVVSTGQEHSQPSLGQDNNATCQNNLDYTANEILHSFEIDLEVMESEEGKDAFVIMTVRNRDDLYIGIIAEPSGMDEFEDTCESFETELPADGGHLVKDEAPEK